MLSAANRGVSELQRSDVTRTQSCRTAHGPALQPTIGPRFAPGIGGRAQPSGIRFFSCRLRPKKRTHPWTSPARRTEARQRASPLKLPGHPRSWGPGQRQVVLATFANRHAAERMLASLGRDFRRKARKGEVAAFLISGIRLRFIFARSVPGADRPAASPLPGLGSPSPLGLLGMMSAIRAARPWSELPASVRPRRRRCPAAPGHTCSGWPACVPSRWSTALTRAKGAAVVTPRRRTGSRQLAGLARWVRRWRQPGRRQV